MLGWVAWKILWIEPRRSRSRVTRFRDDRPTDPLMTPPGRRDESRRVPRVRPPIDRLDRRLPGHPGATARHGPHFTRRSQVAAPRLGAGDSRGFRTGLQRPRAG